MVQKKLIRQVGWLTLRVPGWYKGYVFCYLQMVTASLSLGWILRLDVCFITVFGKFYLEPIIDLTGIFNVFTKLLNHYPLLRVFGCDFFRGEKTWYV